ncbi:MAG: hypothetical protein HKN87_11000 [Saprospiraceae bacterium]|nr:hypothetical protein [Saprospiraceae bacterium]
MIALLLASCYDRTGRSDKLVAQVFDKKLYESEVLSIIPTDSKPEDSILIRNAYIDRWARESVMMHEAEKNIPPDLAIDRLVQDYAASLVMHQYEKTVVESLLDTLIDNQELEAYYEENKSQYLLESTIVRCHFIKVPRVVPKRAIEKIENLWRSNQRKEKDFAALVELCNLYATTFYLSDSIWYKLDLISGEMPKGAVNESVIRSNDVFQLENNDYYYFLKVLEIKDRKEIAPLTYIREQAAKVILHKRKIDLLAKLNEDLYQRASARNDIKIFAR